MISWVSQWCQSREIGHDWSKQAWKEPFQQEEAPVVWWSDRGQLFVCRVKSLGYQRWESACDKYKNTGSPVGIGDKHFQSCDVKIFKSRGEQMEQRYGGAGVA